MAFYNNQNNGTSGTSGMNNLEDDEAKKLAAQGGGTAPVQITGASVNQAAPVGAPPAQNKPASSGSGPGFQSYARANQGNASANLSNAAKSNVQNLGQAANSSVNQAVNKFGQKVEAGTLANRYQAVQDVANTVTSARAAVAAPVPPVAQAAPPVAAPVSAEQQSRFQDVINAKYQGPESLRQAGLYGNAADKVNTASTAVKNAGSAQGREELLRSMYEKRGDYSRGLNKLDTSLLNSSQSGVANLQDTAKAQGNLQDNIARAQIGSSNFSQNRTQEIKGIQEQARTSFSDGKKAEEVQTEQRLADMTTKPVLDEAGKPVLKPNGQVMTEWDKLPEAFKDVIRNKGAVNKSILNDEIAKVKGTNYNSLSAQSAAAKKALDKAKIADEESGMYGASFSLDGVQAGGTAKKHTKEDIAAYRKQQKDNYNSALASYNNANKPKAAIDRQISTLNKNYNPNAVAFNPFEAAVLGVNSGEGLYNLGENTIATSLANKDKLISRDEQLRQSTLAQLAGLDKSSRLDTNLKYDKADLAGTQNSMDALDVAGTRNNINRANENFANAAERANLKGEGKKKVSRGNAFGKTTRTYKASMKGNVADMLGQSGYDVNADQQGIADGQAQYSNDLLTALGKTKNEDNSGTIDRDNANAQLGASATGAAAGASVGSAVPVIGTAIGALAGSVLGNVVQSGTWDAAQHAGSLLDGYAPGAGKALQDMRNSYGNYYDESLGKVLGGVGLGGISKGISGAISGIDTGAMKAMGSAVAKQKAAEDLKRKYSGYLKKQGFDNRADVQDNKHTNSRLESLQQLLASLDKTNQKV